MGLKFIYTLFVGLLLAAFFGFGIETFYPSPKAPDYPNAIENREISRPNGELTAEEQQIKKDYDTAYEKYQDDLNIYNRNVSLIALAAAVITLVISLLMAGKIAILADGLLLGGTLTLFYSIIRGLMTDQAAYRFGVITIGLITTLILGYFKFVRGKVEA